MNNTTEQVTAEKAVSEIKRGDQFIRDGAVIWTAQEDVHLESDGYYVLVQIEADGGTSQRIWELTDGSLTLPLRAGGKVVR